MECPAWRSGSNGQDSTPIIACNAPKSNSGRFRGKALEGSRAGIKPRFPAIVIHLKRHPSYREATNLESGWSGTSLRSRPIRNAGPQLQTAAIIEYSDVLPIGDTAGSRVVGMQIKPGLSFRSPQACDVHKAAVEKVARGRRYHRQRKPACEVAAGVLVGCDVIGQRVQTQGARRCRKEFHLAGRCV